MTERKRLLQRLLSSEVKADLLTLFHGDPSLSDNVAGLARRIGRTPNEIERDIEDLLDLRVLGRRRVGDLDVIVLDSARDNEIQRIIANQLTRDDGREPLEVQPGSQTKPKYRNLDDTSLQPREDSRKHR